VAALNRDLDMARETLRDERAGVRFYASDSSVRAAVEAGATLIEALGNALIQSGEVQVGRAVDSGDLDPIDALRQLAENPACVPGGGRRGFLDGFPWLVTSAYADPGCTLTTNSGREIRVSDVDTCISVLLKGTLSVALLPTAQYEFRLGLQEGTLDYASDIVDAIRALPDTDFRALIDDTAELLTLIRNDPVGMGQLLGESVVENLQAETFELLKALGEKDYRTAGRKLGYIQTEIALAVIPAGGAAVGGGRATARLVDMMRRQVGGSDRGGSGGGGTPNRLATDVDVSNHFQQNRNFWSSEPVAFNGNRIYQRNDLFDPNQTSTWTQNGQQVTGTNIDRMASGRAPIGTDGNPVNLHHMTQTQGGALAEVTQTFHTQNYGVIHINTGQLPSGISRSQFNAWRQLYWQNRAATFGQ